jgi:hypothetical protein
VFIKSYVLGKPGGFIQDFQFTPVIESYPQLKVKISCFFHLHGEAKTIDTPGPEQ